MANSGVETRCLQRDLTGASVSSRLTRRRSYKRFTCYMAFIGLVLASFLTSSLRLTETHIHLDPQEFADHELHHSEHHADHWLEIFYNGASHGIDFLGDRPCDHDGSNKEHHHCGHSHFPILPLVLASCVTDSMDPNFEFVVSPSPAEMRSASFVSLNARPPRAA